MKDGVVIVNTARGAVMDEAALVEALDSGKVWSVGLDVFEEEPKIHPGLLRNPKVMLVPHMGTWTVEVGASSSSTPYINDGIALLTLTSSRHKPPWRNGQSKTSVWHSKRGS